MLVFILINRCTYIYLASESQFCFNYKFVLLTDFRHIISPKSSDFNLNDIITNFFFSLSILLYRDETGNPEPGCEENVCQNVILNLTDGPLK
jgi:hypothetical protein